MTTLTKASPDVRVRKFMDSWVVQRRLLLNNNPVWSYIASYTTWSVAFAVAQVEASPDDWPMYFPEFNQECS